MRVFTVPAGLEVAIDHYGTATNDRPCLVPASVAAELAADPRLRIEGAEETVVVSIPVDTHETKEQLDAAIEAAVETARKEQ